MFYAWKNITYTFYDFRKHDVHLKFIRKLGATTILHIVRKRHTGRLPCHIGFVCVTEEVILIVISSFFLLDLMLVFGKISTPSVSVSVCQLVCLSAATLPKHLELWTFQASLFNLEQC